MLATKSSNTVNNTDRFIRAGILRFFELTNKRIFWFYHGEVKIRIKKSDIINNLDITPESISINFGQGDINQYLNYQQHLIKILKVWCYICKINYYRDIFIFLNEKHKN